MTATRRLFIACDIPQDIRDALFRKQTSLKGRLSWVRWVRPEGIHLTLKFLGDTPVADIPALCDALASVKVPVSQMKLECRGLGAFPSPRNARALWAGLRAPESLAALRQEIQHRLEKPGFSLETRPYSPHLTLGRMRGKKSPRILSEIIEAQMDESFGMFFVSSFSLYESRLHPGGAEYIQVAVFPFTSPEPLVNVVT